MLVKCFVNYVPAVFSVVAVQYKDGEVFIYVEDVENTCLVSSCPSMDDYVSAVNSLYADRCASIGEAFNFKWS
jgi:hypothetical protein